MPDERQITDIGVSRGAISRLESLANAALARQVSDRAQMRASGGRLAVCRDGYDQRQGIRRPAHGETGGDVYANRRALAARGLDPATGDMILR